MSLWYCHRCDSYSPSDEDWLPCPRCGHAFRVRTSVREFRLRSAFIECTPLLDVLPQNRVGNLFPDFQVALSYRMPYSERRRRDFGVHWIELDGPEHKSVRHKRRDEKLAGFLEWLRSTGFPVGAVWRIENRHVDRNSPDVALRVWDAVTSGVGDEIVVRAA